MQIWQLHKIVSQEGRFAPLRQANGALPPGSKRPGICHKIAQATKMITNKGLSLFFPPTSPRIEDEEIRKAKEREDWTQYVGYLTHTPPSRAYEKTTTLKLEPLNIPGKEAAYMYGKVREYEGPVAPHILKEMGNFNFDAKEVRLPHLSAPPPGIDCGHPNDGSAGYFKAVATSWNTLHKYMQEQRPHPNSKQTSSILDQWLVLSSNAVAVSHALSQGSSIISDEVQRPMARQICVEFDISYGPLDSKNTPQDLQGSLQRSMIQKARSYWKERERNPSSVKSLALLEKVQDTADQMAEISCSRSLPPSLREWIQAVVRGTTEVENAKARSALGDLKELKVSPPNVSGANQLKRDSANHPPLSGVSQEDAFVTSVVAASVSAREIASPQPQQALTQYAPSLAKEPKVASPPPSSKCSNPILPRSGVQKPTMFVD